MLLPLAGTSSKAFTLLLSFDRPGSLSRPSNLSVFITSSTMPRSFNAFNSPASSIPALSASSPRNDSSTQSLILECTFIWDTWLWMICLSSWTFSEGRAIFAKFYCKLCRSNVARDFRKRKLRISRSAYVFVLIRCLELSPAMNACTYYKSPLGRSACSYFLAQKFERDLFSAMSIFEN